jgi:hypothetical protein
MLMLMAYLLADRPTAESIKDTILTLVAHALRDGTVDEDEPMYAVKGLLLAWEWLSDPDAEDSDPDAEECGTEVEAGEDGWFPVYRAAYAKSARVPWDGDSDTIPTIIPTSIPVPLWLVREVAALHAQHDRVVNAALRAAAGA